MSKERLIQRLEWRLETWRECLEGKMSERGTNVMEAMVIELEWAIKIAKQELEVE